MDEDSQKREDAARKARQFDFESYLAESDIDLSPDALHKMASREVKDCVEAGFCQIDQEGLTHQMRTQIYKKCWNRFWKGWERYAASFYEHCNKGVNPADDLSYELGQADEDSLRQKSDADEQLENNPYFAEIKQEYVEAKELRDKEKAELGNRKVRQWPLWIYVIVLAIVGALEIPINYTTLLAYLGLPGFAAGSVGIIFLIFMFSGHEHGSVLKQHAHWFGDDVDDGAKHRKLASVLIAGFFLLIALAFIGWARYVMVLQTLPAGGVTALTSNISHPPLALTVSISVFANVLVYGVGFFVSYLRHDEEPEYAAAEVAYKRAARPYNKFTRRSERKKNQLTAKRNKEQGRSKTKARVADSEHSELNSLIKSVRQHGQREQRRAREHVGEVLNDYRELLIDELRTHYESDQSPLRNDENEAITFSDFGTRYALQQI